MPALEMGPTVLLPSWIDHNNARQETPSKAPRQGDLMALRSTNAFPEVTPVACDLVSFASQRDKRTNV
jgi:hypothetical protein